MDNDPLHNDDEALRAAGPYADMVRELVESGRYASTAEVMLEGLALLRERELLRKAGAAWLDAEVQKGIDSADRGETVDAAEALDRLEAKYFAQAQRS